MDSTGLFHILGILDIQDKIQKIYYFMYRKSAFTGEMRWSFFDTVCKELQTYITQKE